MLLLLLVSALTMDGAGAALVFIFRWFMTREATERELVDETTPGWFNYGAWHFFMRFVAPAAVAAILIGDLLRSGLFVTEDVRAFVTVVDRSRRLGG